MKTRAVMSEQLVTNVTTAAGRCPKCRGCTVIHPVTATCDTSKCECKKEEENGMTYEEPPAHYAGKGGIDVWAFIDAQGLDYYAGNVVKYVTRAGRKDDRLADLKKARNFINRMIEMEELK